MTTHCTFLRAGELSAIVGDDVQRGPGGAQYSGVWSLIHQRCASDPVQGAYAALIASAHRGTGPTLEPIDERSARLVRTPTERSPHMTVTGTYTLAEPHHIDYVYAVGLPPYATGLPTLSEHNWCCYMNSPLDRSIHFIEDNVWTTLTPVLHGQAAMVFPTGLRDERRANWEKRTGEARFRDQDKAFHRSFSGRTFDYPFYFGVIHGMIFLLMADCHEDFRFYISPSGAGPSSVPGQASPAWDFQWHVHRPQPGQRHTLNVRIAFFPPGGGGRHPTEQVWQEWERFRDQHPTR